MNDIDRLIKNSSRQELIEWLADPEIDFDSLVICFHQHEKGYGYRILDKSSEITLIGLMSTIKDYFRNKMVDELYGEEDDD